MSSMCRSLRTRAGRGGVLIAALSLFVACDSSPKKSPSKDPVPSVAPSAEPGPDPQAAEQERAVRLSQLRRAANALWAQSAFDLAKEKVDEGLGIEPNDSALKSLGKQIDETLAHRCCGKWLRYDTTEPGDKEKQIRGVLFTRNTIANSRGHLYRARLIVGCDRGKNSMMFKVPWELSESSAAEVAYRIGEDAGKMSLKAQNDGHLFIFEKPEPWIAKLGNYEEKEFSVLLPTIDAPPIELVFDLGKAKEMTTELLAACR